MTPFSTMYSFSVFTGRPRPFALACCILLLVGVGNLSVSFAQEAPPLQPVADSQQTVGDRFWVDLEVGSDSRPVQNLFGASLTLDYDSERVSVEADSAGGFLGSDVVYQSNVDSETGEVGIGITRTDSTGADGHGTLASVQVEISGAVEDGTELPFSVEGASAVTPDGDSIELASQALTVEAKAAPPVQPVGPQSVVPGTTFWADLKVGTDSIPVEDLFGASFALDYDPGRLSVVEDSSGSFLGPDVVYQSNNDSQEGRIEVGVTRKEGAGSVDGSGILARVKLKVADAAPIGSSITLEVADNSATDEQGESLLLDPVGLTSEVRPPPDQLPTLRPTASLEAGPEQPFWVDIEVGSDSIPVEDLFGASFSLGYDPGRVSVVDDSSGSFLGPDVVYQSNVDSEAGQIGVGISRKAGTGGADGKGSLARVQVDVADGVEAGETLTFQIGESSATRPGGEVLPLKTRPLTVSIPFAESATVSGDGGNASVSFESAGASINFSGISGEDTVTVRRFNEHPSNSEGIDEGTVGNYRLVIESGSALSFDSSEVRIAAGSLEGAVDPTRVQVYKRDDSGTGTFETVPTSLDDNGTPGIISDDTLTATVSSFSEFTFAEDPNSIVSRPAEVTAEASRTFGDASGPGDYRLVALPGQVDRPLDETLSGESGADWQAFWDDGSTEDPFVRFDDSETFELKPGRGFWVTSLEEWSVSSSFQTVSLTDGQTAKIPLNGDSTWTIVSNPLSRDVDWGAVLSANGQDPDGSSPPLWQFDTEDGFVQADTMRSARQGTAYYVFNATGLDSLKIPFPKLGQNKTIARGEGKDAQKELAGVSLTAKSTGDNRPASTVRVRLAADQRRSVVAPPGRFEAVSLRIRNRRAESPQAKSLMAATRPPEEGKNGRTFPLRLTSRTKGKVELRAENLPAAGRSATLINQDTEKSYDLRSGETITINPDRETTEFALAIGTEQFVGEKAREVLPDEVELRAFPNPVRQQGTFEYTLPDSREVTLQVYDVLGRRVVTLVQQQQVAGRHTVRLKTEGLSSGVYFGRLKAGDQTRTRKITVVR